MSNDSFYKGFPALAGLDFSPNRPGIFGRVKLNSPNFSPTFSSTKVNPSFVPTPLTTGVDDKSPTEGVYPDLDKLLAYQAKSFPTDLARMQAAAELQAQLSQRQLYESYPLLSAAAAESTARNLSASKAYRTFTEGLPSTSGQLMSWKQAQATSAAAGEADRARAVAAQQDAAKNYAGRFAGQYIQVG